MLTYGFYDSLNGDRTYNAEQMSRMFDGIICDGVFGTVGEHFAVHANGWMRVRVGDGRAWFNGTWTDLRSTGATDVLEFELDHNAGLVDRTDWIVLVVDKRAMSRENSIKLYKNTYPSNTSQTFYYPLASINVEHNSDVITQADITSMVGTSYTPFVTGPLETISIDDLIEQWESGMNARIDAAIEAYFDDGTGVEFAKVPQDIGNGFGICASSGISKTAVITGYKLVRYGRISIRFNYAVPANATLNINGLGAKPIYYDMSPITDGIIPAYSTATFVYDDVDNGRYYLTALDTGGTGGTSRFVTLITNSGGVYSSTETYADIVAAAERYDIVIADTPDGTGYYDEDDSGAVFNVIDKSSNGTIYLIQYKVGSSSVTRTSSMLYQKPDGGITLYDLDNDVQKDIMKADFGVRIAQSTTQGGTVPKTADLASYSLFLHSMVAVHFTTPVEASATLNINSTGAKAIYHRGSPILQNVISYGDTALFVYDGTNYNLVAIDSSGSATWNSIKPPDGIPESDLASAVQTKLKNAGQGHGYATCSTALTTTAKTASLTDYELVTGGSVSIKFTNGVRANATLSINNKTAKAIYYHGSPITDNIIGAGDTATFRYDGTYYHLIAIDRRSNSQSTFFVHINYGSGSSFACVESFSDIYNAFDNNTHIVVILDGTTLGWLASIDSYSATMYVPSESSGELELYEFTLTSSDVLTMNVRMIGDVTNPATVTLTSATPSVSAPSNNTIYDCTNGSITSVTVSSYSYGVAFVLLFDAPAGASAPTLSMDGRIRMPDDFEVEANKHYEINVDAKGYAAVHSWDLTT